MINPKKLHPELVFQTARSGGSGGQNVNKVETKVELRFDIANSNLLSEEDKQILINKLSAKLTNENVMVIYHQTERSQLANKDKVVDKFNKLIQQAFFVPKKRRATRPTLASKLDRLAGKQKKSQVKSMRRKPIDD